MSIEDKLITIEENNQKVFNAGQFKTFNEIEAFNSNVSGTFISANDVAPIEHNIKCNLSSKNLFDKSKLQGIDSGKYGTTNNWGYNLKIDSDGDDILVTSKTGFFYQLMFKNLEFKIGQTYTVSLAEEPLHENNWGWYIAYTDDTYYPNNTGNYKTSLTFTIEKEVKYICLRFGWGQDKLGDIRLVKPQLELGTTATPYTPYIESLGGIEVSRYGKNLFNSGQLLVADGWTETDGVYSGIPGALSSQYGESTGNSLFNDFKPNTQYTLSFKGYSDDENTDGAKLLRFRFKYSDDTSTEVWIRNNVEKTYTLTSTAGKTVVGLYASYGKNPMCYVWDIQLELGTIATDYEAYIEPATHQSTTDGTVEGIKSIAPSMILLTNNDNIAINAHYYRDIDKYLDNLTMNVALTGGE